MLGPGFGQGYFLIIWVLFCQNTDFLLSYSMGARVSLKRVLGDFVPTRASFLALFSVAHSNETNSVKESPSPVASHNYPRCVVCFFSSSTSHATCPPPECLKQTSMDCPAGCDVGVPLVLWKNYLPSAWHFSCMVSSFSRSKASSGID